MGYPMDKDLMAILDPVGIRMLVLAPGNDEFVVCIYSWILSELGPTITINDEIIPVELGYIQHFSTYLTILAYYNNKKNAVAIEEYIENFVNKFLEEKDFSDLFYFIAKPRPEDRVSWKEITKNLMIRDKVEDDYPSIEKKYHR